MKQTTFLFCSLITLILSGCTSATPSDPTPPLDTPTVTLTGTYSLHPGDALKTLIISGKASFADQEVAGVLNWTSPETTFDTAGEYDIPWVFTPQDTKRYNQVMGTQKVTVQANRVYVIGNFSSGPDTHKALFWIDEVPQPLEQAENALTTSLFVSGNDSYITGFLWENDNPKPVSIYWKNGTIVRLTDQGNNPYPTSIFVEGNDVYVSGSDAYIGENTAGFWKNGKFTLLDTSNTEANAIYVSNGDVYVVGRNTQNKINHAMLWKNGESIPITTMQNAVAVSQSGNNLYIAGYSTNAALYTNGTVEELFNSSTYANSMFVSGSEVYICGENAAKKPLEAWYWHNGTSTILHDGTKEIAANSIYVADQKVYVAGCSFTGDRSTAVARVWINGVATALPSDEEAGCVAIGVVVK